MQMNPFCIIRICNKMSKGIEQQQKKLMYSEIKKIDIKCMLNRIIGTLLMNLNELLKQNKKQKRLDCAEFLVCHMTWIIQ